MKSRVRTGIEPRPTLVRRVVFALLLAFAVIFALNLAAIYWQVTGQAGVDARLRTRAQTLLAAVDGAADAAQARAVASAVDAILNPSAPAPPLLAPGNPRAQRQGGVLVVLADAAGLPPGGSAADAWHEGRAMRVYQAVSKRWAVTIGEPAWSPGWLLLTISRDMGVYVVLAFLLVLAATWLAVARGLRPLRQLSDTIAARGPDDLRPLGANGADAGVHAELAPLVAAIDRLLAQLRGKLETERGFVQDAAHELRTPLAVISAQAHVLAASPGGAARAGAERDMDRAIERASRLIRQLLALARIDSAPAHEPRAVDVALAVRHELALLAPAAMARAIELSLESPDVLMHAVDVPALQSIVQNLLANAIGYCGEGAQVVVGLALRGGVLSLSVADDGPGIVPAEQGEVFERFRRGSGHDAPGSGLGLAIVRQAAARMGGTVRLAPGLGGKGCAFVTELPGPGLHGPV
jgi:two-component system sensor histidine kinase QseC